MVVGFSVTGTAAPVRLAFLAATNNSMLEVGIAGRCTGLQRPDGGDEMVGMGDVSAAVAVTVSSDDDTTDRGVVRTTTVVSRSVVASVWSVVMNDVREVEAGRGPPQLMTQSSMVSKLFSFPVKKIVGML